MKETRLQDYREPDFFITSVKLQFQLFDHETLVTATSTVKKNNNHNADEVCLLGRELQLVEFKINGQVCNDYKLDLEHLRFKAPSEQFEIQITTRIHPEKNKSLMGLYRSRALYATQMEPEGFRRVTFFVDRPDNMAHFSTRIEADKKQFPVLLSNGNLMESGELSGGRHYVEWRDPHLKPCYLFALVAGDLAVLEDSFTTMSQKKVALKIFTEPKYLDQCHHAMSSLKKSMLWDEQVFGREYDLDNFMIVAVDDFNFGAMENKGLNIYNAPYLLANAKTGEDSDFQNIEGVVAHEYFHNWSGNRVTLRDWFQISLKEGFTVFRDQEFSSDMNSRGLQRISDVRFLRSQQFPEDGGPRSHPIQPKSYMTIDNFYTRTVYQKGGEVIHMFKTLLGPQTFRKATDLYFEKNDGRSATTEDFVEAMEQASGRDFTQFRHWYHQSGTPIVSVQTHYDSAKQVFELHFEQRTPPTADQRDKTNLHIPIRMALLGANGQALSLILDNENQSSPVIERVLELTQKKQTFRFINIKENPVPSLFRQFSAPVKVEGLNNEKELRFLMAYDSDPYVRWDSGFQLVLRAMKKMVLEHHQHKTVKVESSLLEALAEVLTRADQDPALAAELLTLPEPSVLENQLEFIDPLALATVRDELEKTIALKFEQSFLDTYKRYSFNEPYAYTPKSVAARSLKNVCLNYLVATGDEKYIQLATVQLTNSNNMTDQRAALQALTHAKGEMRDQAVQNFYKQWKDNTLVMNKYFQAQASSRSQGVTSFIQSLAADPAFDMDNPNKIRSLFGVFVRNGVHFHNMDGSGYKMIADQILRLDQKNPMLAASLSVGFASWVKHDDHRKQLMKNELNRILSKPDLSKNVTEVISKTLAMENV